ncbi:hypothetical protein Ahy_B05g074900 [Arachis hypogaea]|uniref:Protein FAR1-RELATED SEQUENCE n=1 Tax=Arachis hypogaea TaxID=3818 RepID=A0A444Z049_ARAHY|nr:hypothetical protein Ahy_B05g074900 [Arachis hypogaea]
MSLGFSTNIWNTNKKENEIKNQLTNPLVRLNCPVRIYIHILKDVENNKKAKIKPSKTYKSFVAVTGCYRKLSFIEKDERNYITREVQNISELEDAKEFGKCLLRMKEKNQNFFSSLNLRLISQLRLFFGPTQEIGLPVNILEMYNLVFGSFVGVNHYGQSTHLGCALMKNENIQSFK